MFLLGGLANTKGIILEQVQSDIGLSLSQIGLVVFIFQWGFVIASMITGFLTDKKGLRFMMLIGASSMVIGLFATGFAATVFFFLGFYSIVGLGIGSMTVSINAIIPALYKENAGSMFNIANGVFGLGMIFMPIIMNVIFANDLSWRYFYIGLAAVIALTMIVITFADLPKPQASDLDLKAFLETIKNKQFMFVMLFLVFYVSSEASFMNFFPIYYKSLDIAGMTLAEKTEMAGYVIASFSVLFTIGRFAGGFINYKLGERNTLILFSGLSVVSLVISKLFAAEWAYLFMSVGLMFSVLFPTATAIGAKTTNKGGSALGFVYVAAGIGGAFAGWLVGVLSDIFGPSMGFNIPIVFVVIMFGLSLFIKDEKKTVSVRKAA
ncbi:MFS transporter [Bacillus taeanensis]|uniref:MFS transporter n=2 Tax=Bacillus taeanensis TaxID=273032 RepID=A0A366XXJ6_9BACI|nr:MFS transporter [Bacillus taeanensis]